VNNVRIFIEGNNVLASAGDKNENEAKIINVYIGILLFVRLNVFLFTNTSQIHSTDIIKNASALPNIIPKPYFSVIATLSTTAISK